MTGRGRFRVTIASEAFGHLDAIFDYIAIDSPTNARKVVERILQRIDALQTMPRRYPVAPDVMRAEGELRHTVIFSYRIVYEVVGREVVVHAVRHGRRRPIGAAGGQGGSE